MAVTSSTMLELGTRAPAFALPDTDGKLWSLEDFSQPDPLLVMFICNHCPFVKHVQHELAKLAATAGLSNEEFTREFEYLVANEPPAAQWKDGSEFK